MFSKKLVHWNEVVYLLKRSSEKLHDLGLGSSQNPFLARYINLAIPAPSPRQEYTKHDHQAEEQ